MDHKKLKMGIAGVRGLSTVMGFNAMDNMEITALCDAISESMDHLVRIKR